MTAIATQQQRQLTPKAVLDVAQKVMMAINAKSSDYSEGEPFPVEISELFLYSSDGINVQLVFQFLGNECVLSETEIALEHQGKMVVLKEPLRRNALEFLILRLKTMRELGF